MKLASVLIFGMKIFKEENAMTFKLGKASDWGYSETVEINTIEDLKSLSEKYTERPMLNFRRLILDFGDTGDYPECD